MLPAKTKPRVVLLCHDGDRIDTEGLVAWLATSTHLVGVVTIRSPWQRAARAARREIRRSGWVGFLDALALRLYYGIAHRRRDHAWHEAEIHRIEAAYPGRLCDTPRLITADPNTEPVRSFLTELAPDIVIARCKVLLTPSIFSIARAGTFAMHPGICPEYRNAHGCFWALVRRDLTRVGMTLLRIDHGVDTGPVFLRASCTFDERRESHIVIQSRAVTGNLDVIASKLLEISQGVAQPLVDAPRESAVWGQPRLSAYWAWKRAARREHPDAHRLPSVS